MATKAELEQQIKELTKELNKANIRALDASKNNTVTMADYQELLQQHAELKLKYAESVNEIEILKNKLSREGTGKPRNNNTTNQDVYNLRKQGKTIREIVTLTGLSSATITKILKLRFNS